MYRKCENTHLKERRLPQAELPDRIRDLFAILCYSAFIFILGIGVPGFFIALNFCLHICNFVEEIMNALQQLIQRYHLLLQFHLRESNCYCGWNFFQLGN